MSAPVVKEAEKVATTVHKAIVAGGGFIAEALATGLVPEPVKSWLQAALAVATVLGVYVVPNKTKPQPEHAA